MFERILIANRGLIQANCVRAVKQLGARALTLFEEDDRDSAGVRNADEAYCLEQRDPEVRPYLDLEQIVGLAEKLKVDAAHPGYGFLAQNTRFARELEKRGIHLIAPRARGSVNFSNKAAVKEAARQCGLPVLDGSAAVSEVGPLREAAGRLRFPLLVKPAHGYGGIGLRRIRDAGQLEASLEAVQAVSRNFLLNSPDLYIEQLLPGARHLEFPVLRDAKGRTVVFPELDCSLQRRYQKLMVETPAWGLDPDLRARLQSEVRVLCERLGIQGFASVEFLLKEGRPWFLEINNYIQPSHTATALLTGVDVLKEQIRLFAGAPLEVPASAVKSDRHVLGVYVFAEDPENNFVPSPGFVDRLYLPFGEDICLQTSIFSGARVSPYYDPMVAKLLSCGNARDEAVLKLKIALEEFFVEGVKTNLPLLRGVLDSPEFIRGDLTTDFLGNPDNRQRIVEGIKSERDAEVAALVAALALHRDGEVLKRVGAEEESENPSVFSAATRWLKPRKNRRSL